MGLPRAGGGWRSIWYTVRASRRAGGLVRMYRALRRRNACKTCALGMGGQLGGMVNEAARFPEVCKKSVQAMAADLQGRVQPRFFDDFSLEKLRGFSPRQLEEAGRLVEPVAAGPLDSCYRPVPWAEALERIAAAMRRATPERSFFYASGRTSNEAGFLLQLLARSWGTNHVSNCSYYCHQASGVAMGDMIGSGTASVILEDLERCDLVLLMGANPASNHPRFMRALVGLRRRGGRVIVVNPLREVGLVRFKVPSDVRSLLGGSTIADLYVQPRIGGDVAFLSGVARAVIERGAVDGRFLEEHVEGWDAFRAHVSALPWPALESAAGVDRATMERVADLYAASRGTIFAWAMGITHHLRGVDNVRAIANLALLRGMVGGPGRGLLPLRGHSNVQGVGSMGVAPALKPQFAARLADVLGVKPPPPGGLDTLACLEAAHGGRMGFAWCQGGNLYGASPDAAFASAALGRIDLVVYLSTTLNTGHVLGRGRETIILPVLPRDEEPQATTQESMFCYVRRSDGGPPRHQGPRSEVEILAEVAESLMGRGGPVDWRGMRDHARIRAAIAAVVPGYAPIGDLDRGGGEFVVEGRTLHEPRFPTPDGRARMRVVALDDSKALRPDELRLMTVRSEGQFNTVVYEEEDVYRGTRRRDVIMMNRGDIERLGLVAGGAVRVSSSAGSLAGVRVAVADVPAGNGVMYFPEANVLIGRQVDAESRTPAYKGCVVRVEALARGGPEVRERA
jgi:molybdopterin-dependent oxidoreductase alpha subunit